jgi:hypothetical protein
MGFILDIGYNIYGRKGMKKIMFLTELIALAVASIFLMFAIDSLFASEALVDRILTFLILITPGLLIILVLIFFRSYYRIRGLMFLGLGLIYFFFFRPYKNFSSNWPVLLMIILPLIFIGCVYLFYISSKKHQIES